MNDKPDKQLGRKARTIEAAALAGVIFVLLDLANQSILASAPDLSDPGLANWYGRVENQDRLLLAVNLASLSTVAFLWFLAVIRRRLGDREDQFFSTVFFGSGLVLIVSKLLATAAAASPAMGMRLLGAESVDAALITAARSLEGTVSLGVALRMQAVFVFSTSTVILRTAALPAWLARLGYGFGVIMFVVPFITEPMGIAFPLWILLVSIAIFLIRTLDAVGEEMLSA